MLTDSYQYTPNSVPIIKSVLFAINLVEGQPQKDADDQLKMNLQSADAVTKARAILSLIYQIRNNMQHDQKHFEEYQRLLLEPVIGLLENILELLRVKLGV